VKIARWRDTTGEWSGFIVNAHAYALPSSMTTRDLCELGLDATLALADRVITESDPRPLSEIVLRAPLDPVTIRDFVAFEEHVEGVVKSVSGDAKVVPEWYEAPTFYFTNPHTVHATGDGVAAPSSSTELDFELELAAIIGNVEESNGRDLDAAEAHRHIFGYTIMNDWSARDVQRREMKVNLGPAKGKDFATTLGPWIVTADEFEARHDDDGFLPLIMSVSINGAEFGRDLFSNCGWPFAELVSYASRNSRIVPGDVLGSGTVGGGCLAEAWGRSASKTPRALIPGDVVTMEVDGIGVIENTIVRGTTLPPVAPARSRSRNRGL